MVNITTNCPTKIVIICKPARIVTSFRNYREAMKWYMKYTVEFTFLSSTRTCSSTPSSKNASLTLLMTSSITDWYNFGWLWRKHTRKIRFASEVQMNVKDLIQMLLPEWFWRGLIICYTQTKSYNITWIPEVHEHWLDV